MFKMLFVTLLLIIKCMCMQSYSSSQILLQLSQTAARQAPLPMGFSRQQYWSGLPCPPPGDLPDPGTDPHLLCLPPRQAGSLPGNSITEHSRFKTWGENNITSKEKP